MQTAPAAVESAETFFLPDMRPNAQTSPQRQPVDIQAAAGLIAAIQRPSGEIPWHDGGKTDPWDHVEAAMGLTIGGFTKAARHAYRWLSARQLKDGSWYAGYRDGRPSDRTRDTNFSAYIAVGLFHYYLVTGDLRFVDAQWPTLRAAIDFAVQHQTRHGDVYWAVSPQGDVDRMALLTGCSAIFMSLKCALAIARLTGRPQPAWQQALAALGHAIRFKPHRFNMTKSRFSMDWFYPILAGAVTGRAAQERLDASWKKFVVVGQGVRCVSDQPWVTLAETSELILTLAAMGHTDLSHIVFNWISEKKFDDGSFWCGFTCPDIVVWPGEKMTWTNAAVLMAADALFNLTPAAAMFNHRFWSTLDDLYARPA